MYETMHRHWKSHGPPVYMAVAAYLGIAKPTKKNGVQQGDSSLEDIMRKYGGAGGVIM